MHPRQQAKLSNLEVYFTGKPCKQGHITQRRTRNGSCIDCGIMYNTSDSRPAERRKHWLKKNYGMSQEEYNLKLKEQNNGCAICGRTQTTKNLAVDHCHTSGKIRSLLCGPCNTGLGQFMDNPELLIKAADYLKGHHG